MKIKLIFFFLFISLISCEKQTEWQLKGSVQNTVVVEGVITDEFQSQTIKLSLTVGEFNKTPQPISGAEVIVSNEDSTYSFTETPVDPGIYKSNLSFAGMLGKNYTLTINYNNNIYSAKTTMIAGSLFHPLQYLKNSNNDLYHISKVSNTYSPLKYAMWEILLDWSKVQGFQNHNPDSCKARLLYYSLPTIDVGQVFSPEIEKVSFPLGTTITQKRYSLTSEYAEFIRALLYETSWEGGLFDSAHSNLPTNISNGAVGYFSACSVTSLFFKVSP